MKVALVHDFLTQLGGAERVLQAFHELFPTSPVYTLVYDKEKYDKEKIETVFDEWGIRPSFIQKLPRGIRSYKWYLPLMPKAIESFDLSGYDVVLSDSSAFAKGVITKKPTRHICYCHTPTRYLWSDQDYVENIEYPWLVRQVVKPLLRYYLRPWDLRAAQRPDVLIANSKTVQARIKKYYQRDSEVIYPPVDTEFFRPVGQKQDYFFAASRLEPYKKIELVVQAFSRLGLRLKVAGEGSRFRKLKTQMSNVKTVEFLGRVSDGELRALYSGAKAFVFPALEDSGIMVLEALACGTPVIGLNQGGTAEFIRDGENGILFENQATKDIIAAVERLKTVAFDPVKLRETASLFSTHRFKDSIFDILKSTF